MITNNLISHRLKRVITLDGNVIFFIIILMRIIIPPYFRYILPYSVLQFFVVYPFYIAGILFTLKYHRYIRGNLLWVVVICVMPIFSTIINSLSIYDAIFDFIVIVEACIVISVIMHDSRLSTIFIKTVKYLTLAFFIIHLFTMIIYKDGIPGYGVKYAYYLYGNSNTTVKFIYPGLLCSILVDQKNKKISLSTVVFILGMIYQYLQVYNSATSLTGILFILVWILFKNVINKNTKTIIGYISIAVIILEITIVVLSNASIVGAITSLFSKSSDFSGRFILWNRAIKYFQMKPMLGYGVLPSENMLNLIGNASGCHNYYVDLLFQRGLIGVIPFALFLVLTYIKLPHRDMSEMLYTMVGFCLGYLIMFLMEPFIDCEQFFIPLFYAIYALLGKYKNDSNTVLAHPVDIKHSI